MDFNRYATASERLLQYAELNKGDSELDRRGGEIVYIFDTNVLESYWQRNLSGIGGRYSTDVLLTEQAQLYSGWLTLKFLIEQRLPGQGKRSGFISPSHWNEAMDRVAHLQNEIRLAMKDSPSSRQENAQAAANKQASEQDKIEQQEITASLRSLGEFGHDPEGLLKEAERLNVGKLFTSIMQAVSRTERVRRVFMNGRHGHASIRDLTACDYYGGQLGRIVRHQDFRRWHSALSKHRTELARSRSEDPKRSTRNVTSDATTLASIQTMYRGNPNTRRRRTSEGWEEPTLRFVFVTADIAIHEAYADLQGILEHEGIPFFLRHPHVYAPLLNHANMTLGEISKDQYNSLKTIFDGVQQALVPLVENYDPRSQLIQGYERKLKYNVALWSKTVETICVANSHYVLSDTGGEYVPAAELAKILGAEDVREAAAQSGSEVVGKIRDSHFQVLSLAALDSLQRVSNEFRAGGSATMEYRAPVKLVGVDIAGALGYPIAKDGHAAWLDRQLRSFLASQEGESPDDVVERVRAYWDDDKRGPAVQLLACCIFFAANEWELARLCAQLCDQRIKTGRRRDVWVREANYCEALALRMQLTSADDVERASKLLGDNISERRGDPDHADASLRDLVERASLVLTAAIVQTIEGRVDLKPYDPKFIDLIPRNTLVARYTNAVDNLEYALKELPEHAKIEKGNVMGRIRLQAEINLLGAYIFAKLFSLTEHVVALSAFAAARQRLENGLRQSGITPSLSAKVYLKVSDALIHESRSGIKAALEFLSSQEIMDSAKSRPDLREIAHLRTYLESVEFASPTLSSS